MSTHGYGARRRASKLRDAPADPQESENKLEQAIYWSNRIRRGEDLHLTDLCISTVQRHVTTLIRHVEPDNRPAIYHGLCPGCGLAVELEREA